MNTCMAQHDTNNNSTSYYCDDDDDDIRTHQPSSSYLNLSDVLSSITLCRSQSLYLRTSLGLFQVSSVDYNAKLLTISHSCSPSLEYVSPLAVTKGFPSPPTEQNSLLLFNCSIRRTDPIVSLSLQLIHNCIGLSKCGDQDPHVKMPYSCLVIEDLHRVDKGFHPEQLNCSHYSWIHRTSSEGDEGYHYKLGTRMSFDIPGHVENLCRECERPNGNCGLGLKCFCHAKQCKDKIISESRTIKFIGTMVLQIPINGSKDRGRRRRNEE
ncbi:hypothetical protein PIB30_059016 [Stylosanthes scabra]|uniref:Uncharacterized protein n=1 Tax=Stylosanthes scabra TaxID=79078 RepID=A0ABU6QK12_9FABA|nr:hypothetical protein [Stylosanthes scabra]